VDFVAEGLNLGVRGGIYEFRGENGVLIALIGGKHLAKLFVVLQRVGAGDFAG
jgi:hypothetical protein